MRIGVIGNMNNAYFALTRYLRDRGYDCELMIFEDEPAHFDPSFDTDSEQYTSYSKKLSWGDPAGFLQENFKTVKKDLEEYDFLIGNGPAPAYVAKVGRKLDIFMPFGYDLYSLPFLKIVHPLRQAAYLATRYYQRKGIREADYILFDRTNKEFETVFTRLNHKGKRIVCPNPMIYHRDYQDLVNLKTIDLPVAMQKIRKENDLVIVQHARQVWKNIQDPWSGKGNDELIKGFKQFLGKHASIKAKLILFDYGTDVQSTKDLVRQFQLDAHVIWMPKMARKDLMGIIAMSDLAVGELQHSWLTYGVALEALALGKPLMHFRKDEEFATDYSELYPMLCANKASSVLSGLEQLVTNKNEVEEIGRKGRVWFEKYCVEFPINIIANIIEKKKQLNNA